jgi:hypothetical protein
MVKVTRLGKTCTNRYTLLDKRNWRKDWEVMSTELTSGEVNLFNLTGKAILLQRLSTFTSIVTESKSNRIQVTKGEASPPQEFSLSDTLKVWEEGKDVAFQILAFFIERKKLDIKTKAALNAVVSRHVKAARSLVGFEPKKIVAAMDRLQRDEDQGKYKWTLETVLKDLTK